eukprot:TRINITY_DN4316_c0_g1_i1.p1 TRINITY_DN4316_c0_g1~~TRINITY_DN4316_c0_g1_i1.p1  ORF type:complete len:378 (-),score=98.62 TRINITY_DN4316_c0_g1_i1:45-1148(-)
MYWEMLEKGVRGLEEYGRGMLLELTGKNISLGLYRKFNVKFPHSNLNSLNETENITLTVTDPNTLVSNEWELWNSTFYQTLFSDQTLLSTLSQKISRNQSILKSILFKSLSSLSLILSLFLSLFDLGLSFILFLSLLLFFLSLPPSLHSVLPPSPAIQSLFLHLSSTLSSVFHSSLILAVFHSLLTYYLCTLFQSDLTYFWTLVSIILSVVPIIGVYWVGVLSALELWLRYESVWRSGIVVGAQVVGWMVVDPVVQSEIRGAPSMMTGLSVAGGIYLIGVEGAVVGPLLFCVCLTIYRWVSGTVVDNQQTNSPINTDLNNNNNSIDGKKELEEEESIDESDENERRKKRKDKKKKKRITTTDEEEMH